MYRIHQPGCDHRGAGRRRPRGPAARLLLGTPISYADDDFVVVAANSTTSGLAFQRSPDQRPPTWPEPSVPQQIHLDVMVDDPTTAGPAGHPFCLIPRPAWSPPVN